jgi:ubiquinone/menaquinone biosynthesis C-methylase UbiE
MLGSLQSTRDYRMRVANKLTPVEWENVEREEHDRLYQDSLPFFFKDYRIDPKAVLLYEDYCFKPNARNDRGHRTKRLFELIGIDHLKGKKVLDVGCGNGQYAVLFSLFGAEVCAFDLSAVGVEVGKRIAEANGVSSRCKFTVQNASSTNYGDEEFDIIVFHETLHHVIKYPGVRDETLRILKSGGIVVCAESLRGNVLFDLARKITMRGEEAKGDVIMDLTDIKDFARDFSNCETELMSLLFMFKRVVKNHTGNPAVRGLLYTLKAVDDYLFFMFPSLRRYSGECVVRMTK